jgi:hypothetical protein
MRKRRQLRAVGDVHDERIIGRPSFGLKNPLYSFRGPGIRTKPVNSFRREGYQHAFPKHVRRFCNHGLIVAES